MSAARRELGAHARAAATLVVALALAATGCAGWDLHWPSLKKGPRGAAVIERPPLVAEPPAQLPAPEHLRAGNDVYRAIPLKWEPVLQSEVAGYAIERAIAPQGAAFERVAALWGRGSSAYLDDGGEQPLGDGVTAYYRLRPFDRDGHMGLETSPIAVGTTASLPGPPPAVRAFSRQPREIPLTWRPSPSDIATGYVVERSPSPDGPYEIVDRIPGRYSTSFVDSELGNLRVLFYRVSTRTASGANGPPSDPVRAVTKPEPLPPLGLRLAEAGLGRNVLAWDPNVEADVATYRLLRLHDGEPPRLVASVPASSLSAEDALVGAGERATYAVSAVDRDGLESALSQPIEIESQGYGLAASTGAQGVSLRWNARPEELQETRVLRLGWLGERELGRSPDGEFLDADVEPGRSYRYALVGVRPDGSEAPPSASLDVEVPEPR